MLALFVPTLTYGDLLVGVGTLALAGITAYLGAETRATAKAAREAVEASDEPFVIASPPGSLEGITLRDHERQAMSQGGGPLWTVIHRAQEDDQPTHFVRMKLWNIGIGPTIVEAVWLERNGVELLDGIERFYPLPAGRWVDVEVLSTDWINEGVATMTIEYIHADGRRYKTTSEVAISQNHAECVTYARSRFNATSPSWRQRAKRALHRA